VEILQEGALSFLDANSRFIAGAQAFLESRPTDQPFCLTVALNVPHLHSIITMRQKPTDPELYRTGYLDQIDQIQLPRTYVARADIKQQKIPSGVFFPERRQKVYDYVDSPETLKDFIARQYQTITGVDQMLGTLRSTLRRLALADNTIIIFTSDHGLMRGEFGIGGKALNYEPCLRVPLIVMDPRSAANLRGRRESRFALSVDIAPTLMALAGVEIPATVQGRSLTPLLRGASTDWRTYAFAENLWATAFGNPRIETIRDAEWKYSRYFANDLSTGPGGGAGVPPSDAAAYRRWLTSSIQGEEPNYEELFHLAVDPDETTNLAGAAEHRDVLKRLRTELDQQIRSIVAEPRSVPLDADEQVALREKYRAEARR
jgi:arylsulfatase A-like enzyme